MGRYRNVGRNGTAKSEYRRQVAELKAKNKRLKKALEKIVENEKRLKKGLIEMFGEGTEISWDSIITGSEKIAAQALKKKK